MDSFTGRLKKKLIQLAHRSGIFEIQRHLRRQRVNILMYHRFSENPEPFKLEGRRFERQLRFICQKYNPVHLSEYAAAIEGKSKLPANSCIITIDDGYEDNFIVAYPLLKKYKVPATIFLATDFVDRGAWLWPIKLLYILQNTSRKKFMLVLDGLEKSFSVKSFKSWHTTQLAIFHHLRNTPDAGREKFLVQLAEDLSVVVPERTCGDFLPMTWSQIREMQENGIEFGSHTCTHPILSQQDSSALRHETAKSKLLLEDRLQREIVSFCYPNGQPQDYSHEVVAAVKSAGYKCAVTTVSGSNDMNTKRLYELKRKGLNATDASELYRGLLRI